MIIGIVTLGLGTIAILGTGRRYQVPTRTMEVLVEQFEIDASWRALWFE
jgi:hypothetical protein